VDKAFTLSVAPMMDWTDRHCRYFHRLITRHAWLYTEMVTTGALLHGDVPRHLDHDPAELQVKVKMRRKHTKQSVLPEMLFALQVN